MRCRFRKRHLFAVVLFGMALLVIRRPPTWEAHDGGRRQEGSEAALSNAEADRNVTGGVSRKAEYLDCLRSFVCPATLSHTPNDEVRRLMSWCQHTIGPEIRIACVGDSITYGNGSHARAKTYRMEGNYPLELHVAMKHWVEYRKHEGHPSLKVLIRNFGKGGHTASNAPAKFSYRLSPEFRASKAFAPHLVVFMLGTNDSKPSTWKSVEDFLTHLNYFSDEYRRLRSRPQIIIMAPPPSLSTLGRINASIIRNVIVPAVLSLPVKDPLRWRSAIDLFTPFFDRVKDPSNGQTDEPRSWPKRKRSERVDPHAPAPAGSAWLHDGVHPTIQGHQLIAHLVASNLCGLDADRITDE